MSQKKPSSNLVSVADFLSKPRFFGTTFISWYWLARLVCGLALLYASIFKLPAGSHLLFPAIALGILILFDAYRCFSSRASNHIGVSNESK